ncbi:hypothetical protein ACWCPM_25665 [Streptomyces sp. NPDC002309]
MNTERPDNDDDVAGATGAAEPDDDGRDGTRPSPDSSRDTRGTPGSEESQDQEDAGAREGDAVADDAPGVDAARAPGADEAKAPEPDAARTPETDKAQAQEPDTARTPEADDIQASAPDDAQAPETDDVPAAEAGDEPAAEADEEARPPGPDDVKATGPDDVKATGPDDGSATGPDEVKATGQDQVRAPEAGGEPAAEADDVQPRKQGPKPDAVTVPETDDVQPQEQGPKPDAMTVPEADGVRALGPDAAGPPEGSSGDAGGDARLVPRPSRRRSPAVIASVAVAVLLAGGGGAYLAASAGGGPGGGTGAGAQAENATPPPLALDGYSSPGAPNGVAPGEPDPNGVTYKAAGALPQGPGSAAVHWPRDEVTEADVVRLADALGLDGPPVAEGGAWRIGGGDGQGPGLQVNREAPGTWTFHRHAPGTDNCRSTTVCAEAPATGSDTPVSDKPVSEDAAKKAAAPILKAVGQGSAKVEAGLVLGARRVVNADPVVGGMPTYGWPTGVTVGAQGDVVAANGQLTAPEKGAAYPVLSAERTLALMNGAQDISPRAGIGGCASPVPLEGERAAAPCEEAPGAPPREPITVEDAVFGLASHSVGTRPALVPAWLFEVRAPGARDSHTVTYPAIDPRYLGAAAPEGRPSPPPSEPGDRPGTRDVRVEGYTAEGRELTVSFTGGVCADYTAKAVETPGEVTVTVTERPWKDKVCILIAKVQHRTVQLEEPLGDRRVVGTDGRAVPLEKPGARLPR